MKVKIIDAKLSGTLTIPPSKSYLHRAMIARFLASELTDSKDASDDIQTTYQVLNDLSKGMEHLYFNESATSLRLLIPIISVLSPTTKILHLGQSLKKRPLSVYQKIYQEQKLVFQLNDDTLIIAGKLLPGEYHVDGSISSQFISGLLMALPLLEDDSKIIIDNELVSSSYIRITEDVLKIFNITISSEKNIFTITGQQKYQLADTPTEGDYSQAAFFLAAGALNSKIAIENLNPKSLQGDRRIINIINDMGGNVFFENNNLVSKKASLRGTTIDLIDNIDLGPILFALASVSEGKTIFKNVKRLRYKESNRLEGMIKNLIKLKAEIIKLDDNTIMINGKKQLSGNIELETFDDHRTAMSLAIIKSRVNGYIILDNIEAVNKSYKAFFEDFIKLGGKVDVR